VEIPSRVFELDESQDLGISSAVHRTGRRL
jgi:hypothetical protein